MQLELVERAARGDRDAFESLAGSQIDRLLVVARLVLRDVDLAQDAVQEALVRCWRQLPQLRDAGRFEGWLYRILMRAVADEYRKRRRHDETVWTTPTEPRVPDGAAALADRDELERAFRRLSIEHRAIVVLHDYAGLSLPESAAALGIPPGTAKSRHHYAMSALRASLAADDRLAPEREASV